MSAAEHVLDIHFAESVAAAADRRECDTTVVLERLLDGSPAVARWGDLALMLRKLTDAFTRGVETYRLEATIHALDSAGALLETTKAALVAADRFFEDGGTGVEEISLHLWETCRVVLVISRLLAGAERAAGGDPIRWGVLTDAPAHWLRTDTRAKHTAVL